ncbi:hypothetical protein DSLASN_08800 [Desulfoluna limicola]|uniref:4-oxalocrotonate tautomerase-like domain-containing protein n=1 Tax=Desulfoluna limicola TaxID=2810562 RepID=A0ABM7PCH4_9BACT|nr:tautomerase family protein [Desulfoluna limicola]BCS95248.1 hypothetical protein DSLASN_08800 [Desulfoluna limicola]
MPVIQLSTGKLSTDMKRTLIKGLTGVASEVTGTPEKYFSVVIAEFEDTNLGSGGETAQEIKIRLLAEHEAH